MSAQTIVHHLECWPIVVSNIYGKEHSDATLNAAYQAWTSFMHRGPHVLLMDMTEGTAGATAAQRARVATWLEQNDALLRSGRQLAHVLIFDSAVMRGIVTAVFWLRPPANPHFAAATIDAAVDYALDVLEEHGIPISPERIAAARRAGSRRALLTRSAQR
jgi:hypothetical protein